MRRRIDVWEKGYLDTASIARNTTWFGYRNIAAVFWVLAWGYISKFSAKVLMEMLDCEVLERNIQVGYIHLIMEIPLRYAAKGSCWEDEAVYG